MHRNTRLFITCFIILLAAFALAFALTTPHTVQANSNTYYAAPTGTGSADCSSWLDACPLQTALAQAQSGAEIWVMAGVHYPGTLRTHTFALKNGVALYGGFAGAETSRDQRDWQANLTILSGDIDQNDLTDPTGVVTSTANIVGANAFHVVSGTGVNGSAVLDGFVITAGQANGGLYLEANGGGMLNQQASPTLASITFIGNLATLGGGMYNHESSPTLLEVTFARNLVTLSGGGMFNFQSSPTLTSVNFIDNQASGAGGGMVDNTSSSTLVNVTFTNNLVERYGGGMYTYVSTPTLTGVIFTGNKSFEDGGGMYNNGSSPTLAHVTFHNNQAALGGGMHNYFSAAPTLEEVTFTGNSAGYSGGAMFNNTSNPVITSTVFIENTAANFGGGISNHISDPTLTNALFYNNTSSSHGGAMHNYESNVVLVNVTLNGNTATSFGGGLSSHGNSNLTLTNIILWGNSAPSSPEIYNIGGSTLLIAYSDIKGCGSSGAGWHGGCGTDGGGNIDADPLFVDAPNGNLHLQLASPCTDAGSNSAVPPTITLDLDGSPRFLDNPFVPNTGSGTPPIVDMGAYELQVMGIFLPLVVKNAP